ncbi:MAG TPA: hypothetical protein VF278_17295, partial [Pirellulales bacterium]
GFTVPSVGRRAWRRVPVDQASSGSKEPLSAVWLLINRTPFGAAMDGQSGHSARRRCKSSPSRVLFSPVIASEPIPATVS